MIRIALLYRSVELLQRAPKLSLGAHHCRSWTSVCSFFVIALLSLTSSFARAQHRRSILWLVESAPDSTVQPQLVVNLLNDLLASATDAEHIIEVEGLAAYIDRNGIPVPGCMAGIAPCPNIMQVLAEELRLDIVAVVRVYGTGNRLTLSVRSPSGLASRLLQFEGDSLRSVGFSMVSDFVGASGHIAVTSRPTAATVYLNEQAVGTTPYQSTVPAGIYAVRIELDGYQPHLDTIEIRPEQTRLLDQDLVRLFAQLIVQTTTPEPSLFIDGEPVADIRGPIRLSPGSHLVRLEAPDRLPSERTVELEPGSDSLIRIDLVESPEARRRRRMGYIYERPFFLRSSLRFGSAHSGLTDAAGQLGGVDYTVHCPLSNLATCEERGVPVNTAGLEVELGYSFRYLELRLLSLTYAAAKIGGVSGDGRILSLNPEDPSMTERERLEGRFDGLSRFEIRPLGLGARILLTENWSLYLNGGLGWYTDIFTVDDSVGEQGQFTRNGYLWSADAGARYYLNDTVFVQANFAASDDLSYSDTEMYTGFGVGIGITWEDVLGIERLFAREEESPSPTSMGQTTLVGSSLKVQR